MHHGVRLACEEEWSSITWKVDATGHELPPRATQHPLPFCSIQASRLRMIPAHLDEYTFPLVNLLTHPPRTSFTEASRNGLSALGLPLSCLIVSLS